MTKEETEAINRWNEGDAKTHTRIELAVGDSEIIYLSGALTAREMWSQLSMVKEAKGCLCSLKNPYLHYIVPSDSHQTPIGL